MLTLVLKANIKLQNRIFKIILYWIEKNPPPRIPLVKQELLNPIDHMRSRSHKFFSGAGVTHSFSFSMLYFIDHCLSLCPFSFDHCIICHSSACGFWLPQTSYRSLRKSVYRLTKNIGRKSQRQHHMSVVLIDRQEVIVIFTQ